MAASAVNFGLPDLSGLSETERLQVIAVMQRAKVCVFIILFDILPINALYVIVGYDLVDIDVTVLPSH